MISKIELFRVLGSAELTDKFFYPLNDAMAEFEVDTPLRVAAFLAQAFHESQGFTRMRENLNYSEQGLLTTFPKYFTPEQAKAYARQPERIANRVYASRMGNGPEDSGDGWRYRGVGLFQLTGANNLRACSTALFGDDRALRDPDVLEQPVNACRAAAWFWSVNKLNQLADQEDMKGITKKINGGYNGLKERQDKYDAILRVFGG